MKKALSVLLLILIVSASLSVVASASTANSWVGVYINGNRFTGNVQVKDQTTFVGIRKFATSMDSSAKVTYNYSTRTLTVQTSKLYLTAKDGQSYIVANNRYLYTPSPIFMKNGVMYARFDTFSVFPVSSAITQKVFAIATVKTPFHINPSI